MIWRSGFIVLSLGIAACMLGCDDNGISHKDRPVDTTHFYHLWYALEHPDHAITLEIIGDSATELPAQLLLLPKLQFLDWSKGYLKEVPAFIGDIQYLENLTLYDNDIVNIAKEIGKLNNLARLDLTHNKLTSVPDEICNLGKLNGLFLRSNNISALPDSIYKLINLKYLNIQSNPISKQEIERIKRVLPNLLYFNHD